MNGLESAILAIFQKSAEWLDWPCPLRFWGCPGVPLSRDSSGMSVPVSLCPGTVQGWPSRCPVGNPIMNQKHLQ